MQRTAFEGAHHAPRQAFIIGSEALAQVEQARQRLGARTHGQHVCDAVVAAGDKKREGQNLPFPFYIPPQKNRELPGWMYSIVVYGSLMALMAAAMSSSFPLPSSIHLIASELSVFWVMVAA